MIVGPTAIGKSTIMREVTARDPSFGYVRSFTTRQKRDGEVSSYDHVSKDQAEILLRSDEIVTSFTHPTGDTYGTTHSSFGAEYNLLDTLSGTVAIYRDLPFKGHVVVSLTTIPDEWSSWLANRFPDRGPEYLKRLHEAKRSIEWSLAQSADHHWLVNARGCEADVADRLIKIAKSDPASDSGGVALAKQMLETVDRLISYE